MRPLPAILALVLLMGAATAGCGSSSGTAEAEPVAARGELACPDRSSTIADYGEDARGDERPAEVVARAAVERRLRAGDVLARATGSESTFVVLAGDEAVARVELRRPPHGGGWLVDRVETCSSFAG